MSQTERNLLVFTISSLILLLIGLIMAWSIFESRTIEWLKIVFSARIIPFLILFAIAGLVFSQPGLKAMSQYMPYSDQVPTKAENRLTPLSTVIVLIIFACFLVSLTLTMASEWFTEKLDRSWYLLCLFESLLRSRAGDKHHTRDLLNEKEPKGSTHNI